MKKATTQQGSCLKIFNSGGAERPREEKPRPRGGREGWHESERTNETMRERSGEAMVRDRKGSRGGLIIEFL